MLNNFKSHSQIQNTGLKRSKRKKWIIISIIIVLVLLPVLWAGWLGIVPGLSSIMGARNPKDLGVRYDIQDVESYKKKTSIVFKDYDVAPPNPLRPTEKSVLDSPVTSNLNLSQEELTAAINSLGWDWLPIEKMQVRLSQDIIELSGILNTDNIQEFQQKISGGNVTGDVKNAISWAKRLGDGAPVYAIGSASIKNNQLSFRLLQAEIGRFKIPLGKTGSDLSKGTKANIHADNLNIINAELKQGVLAFDGTYPSVIYVEQ
jgi:hypothetical protein